MKTTSAVMSLARASMGPNRAFMSPGTRVAARRLAAVRAPVAVSRSRAIVQRHMTGSSAETPVAEERYGAAVRYLHWIMAAGLLTCVGTVLAAQRVKGKTKGDLMYIHKSMGLLMGAAIIPRIAIRLASKTPAAVPGAVWEKMAAKVTHGALYVLMFSMPASGIAMGYFGGKGLPFFGMHIDGAKEPRGDIAKNAFAAHKQMGQFIEYMIPLHVGAAGLHLLRGQNILRRMGVF